jgi:DNA-binding transcriptional MocR family regulator
MASLFIAIDHAKEMPLTNQIYRAIREAIETGRAKLPSWRDLAAQLGVSRGTVRVAYERLIAEQLSGRAAPALARSARPSPRRSGSAYGFAHFKFLVVPVGPPATDSIFFHFRSSLMPVKISHSVAKTTNRSVRR